MHCAIRNLFEELLEYIVRSITRPSCEDTLHEFIKLISDRVEQQKKKKKTDYSTGNIDKICITLEEKVHRVGYYFESSLTR